MEKGDLTDEEYKQRKLEAVKARNKKRYSDIFVLVSNICLIIGTLIIICVLMIPVIIIASHLNPASTGHALLVEVLKMVAFIGGLFLGFFIFRKIINAIIRKNHLEDKLTESVKSHYLKKTKEEREMELRR